MDSNIDNKDLHKARGLRQKAARAKCLEISDRRKRSDCIRAYLAPHMHTSFENDYLEPEEAEGDKKAAETCEQKKVEPVVEKKVEIAKPAINQAALKNEVAPQKPIAQKVTALKKPAVQQTKKPQKKLTQMHWNEDQDDDMTVPQVPIEEEMEGALSAQDDEIDTTQDNDTTMKMNQSPTEDMDDGMDDINMGQTSKNNEMEMEETMDQDDDGMNMA